MFRESADEGSSRRRTCVRRCGPRGRRRRARRVRPARLCRSVLFAVLLVCSSVASALKVNLPLAGAGSTMSVSYAVDFASLLLLGADADDARRGDERVEPVHVPRESAAGAYRTLFSMASLVLTVKATRSGVHVARRHAVGAAFTRARCRSRSSAPPRRTSSATPLLVATAIWLSTRQSLRARVERKLPVERAELFRRRRRGRARGAGDRSRRLLDGAAAGRAALPDIPHVQRLHGAHAGSAAARAGSVRPAPRDDRSARARHRREGPDGPEPHPARTGVCRRHRARARHGRERNPGREDGGAAARHRQARRPRAHPVEAGSAHAGRVPEDPDPSAGRRRDHQRRAVPVSGGAADPEPPRALGRQRLSGGAQGRRDSARRADPFGGRLLRRADLRAAVPQGDALRCGDRAAAAGKRQGARPARRPDVHRHVSGAGGRGGRDANRPAADACRRAGAGRAAGAGLVTEAVGRRARTCFRTSRSRTGKFTRCTRSRRPWAAASACRTRWRSSRRS